ncbi:efflux transporter outer membrane subunit [Coralloluteibacterium stylophorae]|uniref:Efflux transporter outer membrane subunit n=1 Tax=Coralloluteibacterium stylophorae TaxID=1776034 RepID=A0A8J7VQJ9_9GAMM|nr:efflux transporter outer membrane subunit [Coralloluteibacterium stylophorae]MBS7455546.1 efflux transporter outer membrane subunit [Coralloluteibacterium stylophorae]
MRRVTAFAAAAAVALAACSTPPVRELPPLPDRYFTAAPGAADARDPAALADWWQAFDDPPLTELVRTALARNLDVQSALADIRLARAQLRQARSALYPRLDVAGQGSRQFIDTERLADSAIGQQFGFEEDEVNFDMWQLALQAEWEIDLFGANRLRAEAGRTQLGSAQAQLVATRLAVASNLAQGYVQARALIAQRAILIESIEVARELERVADARFRLGEVTRLDVEAAAAQRAGIEASLGDIDASLAQATFALDTLIDRPPGTVRARLADEGRVPLADAVVPRGQPVDLLRRRPDVIAAAAGLEAAELQALASRRDLFPKIGLSAALGRTGLGLGEFSAASDLKSLSGQVSVPWFDFGARRAAIDLADAQADSGYVALRQALAGALEDVEVASAQLDARRAQLAARRETRERAQTAWRMARRTYEVGLANLADVLDAQNGLLDARRQLLDTERALALAQIALYVALGGGWNPHPDAPDGVEAVRQDLQSEPVPDRIRRPEPTP